MQEFTTSPHLGIYLGKKDVDLLTWKQCTEDAGEQPSEFAKTAIREKLQQGQAKEAESLSLQQIARTLRSHTALFMQILEILTHWTPNEPERREDGKQPVLHDKVSLAEQARNLGW